MSHCQSHPWRSREKNQRRRDFTSGQQLQAEGRAKLPTETADLRTESGRSLSRVQLFVTVARQASLSMGFSRQEYWGGLPCSPPGDLPDLGTNPCLLYWQVGPLPLVSPGKPPVRHTSTQTAPLSSLFSCARSPDASTGIRPSCVPLAHSPAGTQVRAAPGNTSSSVFLSSGSLYF